MLGCWLCWRWGIVILMTKIRNISTPKVKRLLRAYGMRECYTPGGANILYCGYTAFRLINDYCMEVWNPFDTQSGTINYYESLAERNFALYEMGLESMGVI